ncbi:hypothetical protein BST92_06150 [Nonlabens arenilitoris]|uniref:Uncharacterized protein n=2 Tax=Nonlabens arenilitoris TaxID=1217969 RepID=A0A2S7UAA8_9FLAO|nr:hypothetical protein BST92_06150 [Nonlabens arenilitoris]
MAMFSTTSCERDDTPLETIQEQPQFKIEKLTGSQLTNNHSLNKALNSAKESLGINTFQKSVYDSINGFYIEDTDVNYLTSGTYESYTFKITDPSDTTHLKNMVFSKQMDSTYQAFIVAYDLNSISLEDLKQGNVPSDLTGYVIYTPINSDFQFKTDITYLGEGDCVGSTQISPRSRCNGGGNHSDPNDPKCKADKKAGYQEVIVTMIPCPRTGGGLGNNPPNDTGADLTGGDNPGGTGDDNAIGNNNSNTLVDDPCNNQLTLSNGDCAGVATTPVFEIEPVPTPVDGQTQQFFDSLPEDLRDFINNDPYDQTRAEENKRIREEIRDFLNDENHSDEAKDFAEEVIKAKEEDEDSEVDFEDRLINQLKGKVKCVYEILRGSSPTFSSSFIHDLFGSEKQISVKLTMEDLTGLTATNGGIVAARSDVVYFASTNNARRHKILFDQNVMNNMTNLEIALIILHEIGHSELIERCIQLGMFNSIVSRSNQYNFANVTPPLNNLNDAYFAFMATSYNSSNSTAGMGQWNHELFTIGNYRQIMGQALLDSNSYLTDPTTTFPSLSSAIHGMSMNEIINDFTWTGLEETTEYQNHNPSVLNRINTVQNAINQEYSRSCID